MHSLSQPFIAPFVNHHCIFYSQNLHLTQASFTGPQMDLFWVFHIWILNFFKTKDF